MNLLKYTLTFTLTILIISCSSKNDSKIKSSLEISYAPISVSKENSSFNVILKNTSSQDLRIWSQYCSWGYYSFSFNLKSTSGEYHKVKKRNIEWTLNTPDFITIKSKESYTITVNLLDGSWEIPELDKGGVYEMETFYEVEEESFSKEYDIWTGRIRF